MADEEELIDLKYKLKKWEIAFAKKHSRKPSKVVSDIFVLKRCELTRWGGVEKWARWICNTCAGSPSKPKWRWNYTRGE